MSSINIRHNKMDKFIITTQEELKSIIIDCLADFTIQNKESQDLRAPPKLLYSLRELAEFLGCSVVTAQKLKNSKRIRYRQFGRKCVFDTKEILEDLDKGKK